MGQQFLIENRPGASGAIAAERVSHSPADGYTLLAPTAADTVTPSLRAKLPYNFERDLAPVALVALAPFVLVVHPSVPARNVKELIALARAQPGKLSYGSVGVGTTPHLSGEALKVMAKVDILHVPFKGGAENVLANVSGQVDMVFASMPSLLPLIGSGTPRLRALAVTSGRRASFAPALPTLSESGVPGYDRSSWVGILAPSGVPKEIIARLNAAIGKVVAAPEMKESFSRHGLEPQTNTPGEFGAFIARQLAENAKLIQAIGLKPE
jgi:tripartite-type tricarboxylate transporter receptor subunit TctC